MNIQIGLDIVRFAFEKHFTMTVIESGSDLSGNLRVNYRITRLQKIDYQKSVIDYIDPKVSN